MSGGNPPKGAEVANETSLLGALMILRAGVTPERIQRARDGLQALRELQYLPDRPPDSGLVLWDEYLDRVEEGLEEAGRALATSGYVLGEQHAGYSKIVHPKASQGGAPLSQFAALVGELFVLIEAMHRQTTGKPLPEHNSQANREEIASFLGWLNVPDEQRDTSPRGPIWRALDDYLRHRREADRKRRKARDRR
jgi:hypothetical protein